LPGGQTLPPIPAQCGAAGFWLAVVLTGSGTGLAAAALTGLLEAVQQLVWGGNGLDVLQAAAHAPAWRHLAALGGAGLMTATGRLLLTRLSSGNGIDITSAIWFEAGRLPALRTLGSAILSVIIVGMGAALGREGAPKQARAVIANVMSDRAAARVRQPDVRHDSRPRRCRSMIPRQILGPQEQFGAPARRVSATSGRSPSGCLRRCAVPHPPWCSAWRRSGASSSRPPAI
jgi:hypothetical protein